LSKSKNTIAIWTTQTRKKLSSSRDESRVEYGAALPDSSSTSSRDLDDSYDVYRQSQDGEIPPEEAKSVLRK
jgi:hypothetical protein